MTGAAGGKPLPLNPTLVPGERTRSCQTQDLFDSSPSNKTSNPYMASNPLPTPYYFIFGIYEPLSLILSCIWAAFNPVEVRCFARNYKHLVESKIIWVQTGI